TIDSWFNSLDKKNHFGLAEVPLLYETGTQDRFDAVIVTACSLEEQIRRMVERTGMTKVDANQRLAAQLSGKLGSTDQKIHQADFVIRTDGLLQDTDTQVLAIYQSFMRH
ncbi:MAG: dephospho-CoA kinase, partial [bacterium]